MEIQRKLDSTLGIGPDTTVSCTKCEEQLTVAKMAASQSDEKELLLQVRLRHDMEGAHELTLLTGDISTASADKSCEDYQEFVSAPFSILGEEMVDEQYELVDQIVPLQISSDDDEEVDSDNDLISSLEQIETKLGIVLYGSHSAEYSASATEESACYAPDQRSTVNEASGMSEIPHVTAFHNSKHSRVGGNASRGVFCAKDQCLGGVV